MSEINVENNGGNQTEQHQQTGSSVLGNTLEVNPPLAVNPKIKEEELKGKDDPKKKGGKHRTRRVLVKVVDVDICSPRVFRTHIVPLENNEGKEDKKEEGKEDKKKEEEEKKEDDADERPYLTAVFRANAPRAQWPEDLIFKVTTDYAIEKCPKDGGPEFIPSISMDRPNKLFTVQGRLDMKELAKVLTEKVKVPVEIVRPPEEYKYLHPTTRDANRPHTHRNRAGTRHSNRPRTMPGHFPAYAPHHHYQNMPPPPPPPPPHSIPGHFPAYEPPHHHYHMPPTPPHTMPDHFPAYEPQHHYQNMPAPPPPPPPHYEEHHPLGCSPV